MHDRSILLRRKADLDESKQLILEVWTKNLPELGMAHDLKEAFFDLWNAESRAEAESLYQDWQARISPGLQAAFQPLLTAMSNWHEEIFAFFDHPVTNSYTEALNGLLRLATRQGRGYSFRTIRDKLLSTHGFAKHQRPKYGDAWDK